MIVEKVQTLCKKANITLAQLEKELSFGNGTIRRWDDNSPSVDKVVKVANYFGVSIEYLLDSEVQIKKTKAR